MELSFFGGNPHKELESIHITHTTIHVAGSFKWKDQILNGDIHDLAKLPWIYPAPNCPYLNILNTLFIDIDKKPEWNTD